MLVAALRATARRSRSLPAMAGHAAAASSRHERQQLMQCSLRLLGTYGAGQPQLWHAQHLQHVRQMQMQMQVQRLQARWAGGKIRGRIRCGHRALSSKAGTEEQDEEKQEEKVTGEDTDEANEKENKDEEEQEGEEKDSEGQEGEEKEEKEEKEDQNKEDPLDSVVRMGQNFWAGLVDTAKELVGHDRPRGVHKVANVTRADAGSRASASHTAADEYEYPQYEQTTSEIVVVKGEESAWEKLASRLREAPIIQSILGAGYKAQQDFAKTDVGQQAKKAHESLRDKIADAQEVWETSQNPLVYKLSSAWDAMTAETEEAVMLRELRKLDPDFELNPFMQELCETDIPELLLQYFMARPDSIPQFTGEALCAKLLAEIQQRHKDGIIFDPTIIEVGEPQLLKAQYDPEASGSAPIILFYTVVQQINCISNKKGEILEGHPADVRANVYTFAYQRNYEEATGLLRWRAIDMQLTVGDPFY